MLFSVPGTPVSVRFLQPHLYARLPGSEIRAKPNFRSLSAIPQIEFGDACRLGIIRYAQGLNSIGKLLIGAGYVGSLNV